MLWAAAAFLAVFPLLAVNSTSGGMRFAWIGILAMGGFIGFMAHMREQSDAELHKYAELQRKAPYVRRYRPVVLAIILCTLLGAELLSVAATYATPDRPLLWHGTLRIAEWGTSIFPLIGKYATQMTPPLDTQTLHKTQAVSTLFLAAGALSSIALVPYLIGMPHEQTLVAHRMAEQMQPGRRLLSSPGAMLLILVPFSILCGLAFFLGWLEFESVSDNTRFRDCMVAAACYAHDDLMLIASGFLRIFASYGFWLAGLVFVITAAATSD